MAIELNFPSEVVKEHKQVSERESEINKQLREHLNFSGRRFLLFGKYKEIANLRVPNHLISKPIMAAMIFVD